MPIILHMALVHKKEVGKQQQAIKIWRGITRFETGAHRRLSPVGCVKAALQNKSVVCSGSRVTNRTVMKLLESDNWGGITFNTCTKSICSRWNIFKAQTTCENAGNWVRGTRTPSRIVCPPTQGREPKRLWFVLQQSYFPYRSHYRKISRHGSCARVYSSCAWMRLRPSDFSFPRVFLW